MLCSFDQLPDHSRIWIYPSQRPLTADELVSIKEKTTAFLKDWTAHGADLQAGFCIPYDQFIVIALNEDSQSATGCSIDKSVHFIQSLEKEFDLVLLDKMNVNHKKDDQIFTIDLKAFKKLAKSKEFSSETVVFNHLVTTKSEFENHWEGPAHASWHSRFF